MGIRYVPLIDISFIRYIHIRSPRALGDLKISKRVVVVVVRSLFHFFSSYRFLKVPIGSYSFLWVPMDRTDPERPGQT